MVAACVVTLALGLSGCIGSSRSTAAVCHVFETDAVAFHNHYEEEAKTTNESNAFGALADVGEAPGRLAEIMSKMEAVAPSDIEPAFKTLAGAFKEMSQNEGKDALDPLSGLASGFSLAFSSAHAFSEVDTYLTKHCRRPQ